jgi:hypothetical protein
VVNLSVRDTAYIISIQMVFCYQFQESIFLMRLTDDNDKYWLMTCGSTQRCGFYTWFLHLADAGGATDVSQAHFASILRV